LPQPARDWSDVPELDIEDHAERRFALMARFATFGRPETFSDRAEALRLIGKRTEVHPDDAWASTYPTRECAETFAEANRRHNNAPSLGIIACGDRWLGVTDLRPQLGTKVTDPSVPDDGGAEWRKQNRQRVPD
jgi:hypothetical protein